jgi:hypothetical protein
MENFENVQLWKYINIKVNSEDIEVIKVGHFWNKWQYLDENTYIEYTIDESTWKILEQFQMENAHTELWEYADEFIKQMEGIL